MTTTTLSISEADLAGAQIALNNSRVSSWFADSLNSDSAIWTDDPESDVELNPDGSFNGNVGGRALRYNFPSEVTDLAVSILSAAGIIANSEKVTRTGRGQPQDRTNAHLIKSSRRLPGRKWEAYGTLRGSGAAAHQTVGTTAVNIDQWDSSSDIINTILVGGISFSVITPGDYQLDFHIFIDPSQAPGTQWTYGATVDGTPIGDSVSSQGGSVKGSFSLPSMSTGQDATMTVASDTPGKTFALKDKTVFQFTRVPA